MSTRVESVAIMGEIQKRIAKQSARVDQLIAEYSAAKLAGDQERIRRARAEIAALYREHFPDADEAGEN